MCLQVSRCCLWAGLQSLNWVGCMAQMLLPAFLPSLLLPLSPVAAFCCCVLLLLPPPPLLLLRLLLCKRPSTNTAGLRGLRTAMASAHASGLTALNSSPPTTPHHKRKLVLILRWPCAHAVTPQHQEASSLQTQLLAAAVP